MQSSKVTTERHLENRVQYKPLTFIESSPKLEEISKENGTEAETNGERPSKRQKVEGLAPSTTPRIKPESPPWKKAVADGPSSFTENGMRRSGRKNPIPLELQPPSEKRTTRGAIQKKPLECKTCKWKL